MRALFPVFSALMFSAAALTLAGCGPSTPPPPPVAEDTRPAVPAVPASAVAIRGTVTIDGLNGLPPNLDLRLRLLDLSDPSIAPPVVAERTEPAPKALPYSYALPYEQSRIDPERIYGVEATLQASGAALYGSPQPAPVLTQGGSQRADLTLTRGATSAADKAPADILKADFDALEAAIGGMTRLTGERIDADVTIGWDGFAEGKDVRFARENVDYGDAGSASLRYAYRDGQPWVIAREQAGELTIVGWGAAGQVELNRKGEDGKADEEEIEALREQAERLYKVVKARADKA